MNLIKITEVLKSITKESIDFSFITSNGYVQKIITSKMDQNKKNKMIFFNTINTRKISIHFECEGSTVFIGKGFKGSLNIKIKGDNSLIFIGENANINNAHIRSIQKDDIIAIGNNVTTTSDVTLVSGKASGTFKPYTVIGDDCMLSYNITIRNTDAHPIFNVNSDQQVNQPTSGIHIEPHVWIGQNVTILKSVTVGANSIISLGSVITKSMPRNSIISGVPANYKIDNNRYWARNYSDKAKSLAKFYLEKFKN